jgi:hypothetical protein
VFCFLVWLEYVHDCGKWLEAHQEIWSIKDEGGFPTSTKHDGEETIPFWSSRSRAEKIIKNVPSYLGFYPHLIPLDDFLNRWLKGLEKDGLYVGVNWSEKNAIGYDLEPREVLERIQYELGSRN